MKLRTFLSVSSFVEGDGTQSQYLCEVPLLNLPSSITSIYGIPLDVSEDYLLHAEFLSLVLEQVQVMFDAHEQYRHVPAPTFVFTDKTEPKAFASVTEDGHKYVGITLGKAIGLLRYFQCVLTHPSDFTTGIAVSGSDAVVLPGHAESYRDQHVPSDAKLLELAEGLARFALMFIAGHELGHLAHGHLSTAQNGVALWDEETEASNDPTHFTQAAREMAADRYGGEVLASYLVNLPLDGMPLSLLIHYAQFSVYSLFHIECQREDWVKTFFDYDHPPVQFRQVAGVSGLDTAIIVSNLVKEAEAKILTTMSMQKALEMYEAVIGVKRRSETGIEFARFAQIQPRITQALLNEHRRLHPTFLDGKENDTFIN